MAGEHDGSLTRQLLPAGTLTGTKEQRRAARRAYRYVTWMVRPITFLQAVAHLQTGGECAAIVACERGPKGGWTGATFLTLNGPWPMVKNQGAFNKTWHYGWVHLAGMPHPKKWAPPEATWRAHLELHAPT